MELKNKKKVLLVIDMKNDFIDGALKNEEAMTIIENVNKKIERYRENGDIIIFTRDTHDTNYLNTIEGKYLPIQHCIKGTQGWQISSKIKINADDEIIDKPTFGSLDLANYVATLEPEEIELIGVCTDICVISNAMIMKAKFPEKEICVDATCCAGVTPKSHKNAIEAMKMCHIKIKGE